MEFFVAEIFEALDLFEFLVVGKIVVVLPVFPVFPEVVPEVEFRFPLKQLKGKRFELIFFPRTLWQS